MEEVKQSWSASFIGLMLFIAILTGAAGYFLKSLIDPPPRAALSVRHTTSGNLLLDNPEARGSVKTSFELLSRPDIKISSLFRHQITLINTGDLGLDSITLVFQSQKSSIRLLRPAQVSSKPPNMLGFIVQSIDTTSFQFQDTWIVGLLNPTEELRIEYFSYSTDRVDSSAFFFNVRKKDLVPKFLSESESSTNTDPLSKRLLDASLKDLFLILALVVILAAYIALLGGILNRRILVRRIVEAMFRGKSG